MLIGQRFAQRLVDVEISTTDPAHGNGKGQSCQSD
jgi:hypothetical protein